MSGQNRDNPSLEENPQGSFNREIGLIVDYCFLSIQQNLSEEEFLRKQIILQKSAEDEHLQNLLEEIDFHLDEIQGGAIDFEQKYKTYGRKQRLEANYMGYPSIVGDGTDVLTPHFIENIAEKLFLTGHKNCIHTAVKHQQLPLECPNCGADISVGFLTSAC